MVAQTFFTIKQSPIQFQKRYTITTKCLINSKQKPEKAQQSKPEQSIISKQVNGLIITGVALGLVTSYVTFPRLSYADEDQYATPYEKRLREKERRMELLKGVREKAIEKAASEQPEPAPQPQEGLQVNPFQTFKSMVQEMPTPSAPVAPTPPPPTPEPSPPPAETPNPLQGFKMPDVQAPSNPFQGLKMPEAPKIPEVQAPSNPFQGLKSMIPEAPAPQTPVAPTPPPPPPPPPPAPAPVQDTFKSLNFQEMMQTPPKQQVQEKKEIVETKKAATTMKVPEKLDVKKIEQEQQKKSGKRKGPLPLFVAQLVLLLGYVGLGLLFTKYEKTTSKVLDLAGEKVSELYGVLEEKIGKSST